MPKTPVSQHQKTAPGPPRDTAVATPTMLPVPMVAARAVARAPNWLTSPCVWWSLVTESRMALPTFSCGKRSLIVMKMWVPSRRMIIGHPQTAEDIFSIRVATEFIEKGIIFAKLIKCPYN